VTLRCGVDLVSRITFRVKSGKTYQLFVCKAGPEVATCQAYEYNPGIHTTPYVDINGNLVNVFGESLDVPPRPLGEPFQVNNFFFKTSGRIAGRGRRVVFRVTKSKKSK